MTGRALVFSHPRVIELVKRSFVPYAGDQWYLHRQKDADGEFFWKVAQQGHNRELDRDSTRQGLYVAAPDGALLASDPFRPSANQFLALLQTGLQRWAARAPVAPAGPGAADRQFVRTPPAGSLVLEVFTRIPDRPAPEGRRWSPNDAVARDFAWVLPDEWRGLNPVFRQRGARQPAPRSLLMRLVRFHLLDNVRGEAPPWAPDDVRAATLDAVVEDTASDRLRLQGTVRLQALGRLPRGYDARLQGEVTLDRGSRTVRQFDLLAWGEAWGDGPYTRGAPAGRFPLAVAFSLRPTANGAAVPPHGSRDRDAYLHPE